MADNDLILLDCHSGGVAIAAGTDGAWSVVNPHPYDIQLTTAYLAPAANLTADDTNYTTFTVKNGSTDLVTAEATTTGDLGNLTAGTPVALTLAAAGSALVISQGEDITVAKTDSGTGVAYTGGIVLGFRPVRG